MRGTVVKSNLCISVLTWLFQRELLPDLMAGVIAGLGAYSRGQDFSDIEVASYELSLSSFEMEVDEDVSTEHDISIEGLLDIFNDVVRRYFGTVEDLDLTDVAEVILTFGQDEQKAFAAERGDIFIDNWKFSRAMLGGMLPIVALYANLREQQIRPHWVSYAQLLEAVGQALPRGHVVTLGELRRRLKTTLEIAIKLPFLVSILRNDRRFLSLHDGNVISVGRIEDVLKAWPLAIDLFDPKEYSRVHGLGVDGIPYFGVRYTFNLATLRRFFVFHQPSVDWDRIDELELMIKLRACRKLDYSTVQGIPKNIYEFVVRWITDNRKVWLSANSQRYLGKQFYFDASEVEPGRLLVYGSKAAIKKPNQLGLVAREMVSEGAQQRGMIHSSKILTPFEEHNIPEEEFRLCDRLRHSLVFCRFGVASLEKLANQILAQHGVGATPYMTGKAIKLLARNSTDSVFNIGRNLIAHERYLDSIDPSWPLAMQRRAILEQITPEESDVDDFLKSLPSDMAAVLEQLE